MGYLYALRYLSMLRALSIEGGRDSGPLVGCRIFAEFHRFPWSKNRKPM